MWSQKKAQKVKLFFFKSQINVLGRIFVFKALVQRYQSSDTSTAAMPDIYLIYSLPKLQSKSCLLKSAVCSAALTNHTGGCASAKGERKGIKGRERNRRQTVMWKERDLHRQTGRKER